MCTLYVHDRSSYGMGAVLHLGRCWIMGLRGLSSSACVYHVGQMIGCTSTSTVSDGRDPGRIRLSGSVGVDGRLLFLLSDSTWSPSGNEWEGRGSSIGSEHAGQWTTRVRLSYCLSVSVGDGEVVGG